jgi:hypothetical protein
MAFVQLHPDDSCSSSRTQNIDTFKLWCRRSPLNYFLYQSAGIIMDGTSDDIKKCQAGAIVGQNY